MGQNHCAIDVVATVPDSILKVRASAFLEPSRTHARAHAGTFGWLGRGLPYMTSALRGRGDKGKVRRQNWG